MKVKTTKGELYVDFRHVLPEVSTGCVKSSAVKSDIPAGTLLNQGDAGTYCSIKRGWRDGEIIAQGQSVIHPLDGNSFNKEKGRKIALTKALSALFPGSRDDAKFNRKVVWNAYFNR